VENFGNRFRDSRCRLLLCLRPNLQSESERYYSRHGELERRRVADSLRIRQCESQCDWDHDQGEGKSTGKIHYQFDEAGRFSSGVVLGPNEKFLFKSIYKYDAAGRLAEETHLNKDGALVNEIVYKFSPAGKQIGYSIFDASGKLISGTGTPTPTLSSKSRNAHGR
jgi:hypothetical protein